MNITKSQQNAVARFRSFLNNSIEDYERDKYGKEVTEFEIHGNEYFTGVRAVIDYTNLSKSNLLSFVGFEHWSIHIGKRGKITVRMAPDCYHQFNHKYAYGMYFDIK